MKLLRGLLLSLFAFCTPAAGTEEVVTGLSQSRVGITVNFDGSEIMVFGAVARDAPAPEGPLDVIVTIEGPSGPVTVRRKERVFGIWVNTDAVEVTSAPVYYAVASTRPLEEILSATDDLRHRITLPQMVRTIGVAHQAEDTGLFTEALMRLRTQSGAFSRQDGGVVLERDVLIRADVVLPANLTEGIFRTRVFLLREGRVIAEEEQLIDVHKQGIERFLHRLALDQPLIYGILSLALAIAAGWLASAAFNRFRT